jgi:hypothetical protein
MPEERDAVRLENANRCKQPGCEKRRLGSSDLCPEHLNKRLEAEREARERARAEGAGNWAAWDLPPAAQEGPRGILGRVLEAAAGMTNAAAAAATAAPTPGAKEPPPKVETLAEIRADVSSKLEREAGRLGLGALLGGARPREIVERFAKTASWLAPEQEQDAWRVVRGLVERGVTDVDRWRVALGGADPEAAPRAEPPPPLPADAPRGEVEAELGRAAAQGLAGAASILGATLRDGAKVFAKALEQATRKEGGPLDGRRRAAVTGFLERGVGALAKTARSGLIDAATRAALGKRAPAALKLGDAAAAAAQMLERGLALARRRLEGRYETDAYGRDEDVVALARPLLRFAYERIFGVEASGLEHVAAEGPVLVLAAGERPLILAAAMIAIAIEEGGPHRPARMLGPERLLALPFASSLLQKAGVVGAHPENGERLLREGRVVGALTSGPRPDYALMAIAARAPIVPCGVEDLAVDVVPPALHLAIRFGPPIATAGRAAGDAEALAAEVWRAAQALRGRAAG